MRVTIGRVTLDDGQPQEPQPPRFPNGPVYVVVETVREALRGIEIDGVFVRFDDRGTRYRAIRVNDTDALMGIEPSRIIDRSRGRMTREFFDTMIWRARRANIDLERPRP